MADLIRDTALGYIIRSLSGNRLLQHLEDRSDFQIPELYLHPISSSHARSETGSLKNKSETQLPNIDSTLEDGPQTSEPGSRESIDERGAKSLDIEPRPSDIEPVTGVNSRVDLEKITSRADLERAVSIATLKKEPTRPIAPQRTSDGVIVVDWYATDDPANPQNWSLGRKNFVSLQICLYTSAVYLGSAIYTPSESFVIDIFGVSPTAASLGLALYVLGYGTGPLLFSPLSEIPIIGRNPPYIITFAIFVILCVPTALVDNFAGLLVLRFLQGFFGSPCLATGGASFQDLYNILQLPFMLTVWVAAATCGPSLGPLIAGFSVTAENWHWSLWEILWLSGPIFILLFLCLPETSSHNILLRRARRLRKLTGNDKYRSQSEIDQSKLTASKIFSDAIWKPTQIHIQDPAITFATLYSGLTYGIYYSFFEAFPLVYIDRYELNLGEQGLTFLSITVSILLVVPAYSLYLYTRVNPSIRAHGLGAPEDRLIPALGAACVLPIGLFIFAWTGNGRIHWVVSLIGVALYSGGVFIVFQCIFLYVPLSYPQYAASLFAGNDFARSVLAAAAVLFARPLFLNLGVERGVSLLAGLTVGCVFGVWALWWFGASLRARSRFTVK